ncbi:MAG TPA: N-acetylmuramoyl-L-alanine amidase [Opitutaceae bacterium]
MCTAAPVRIDGVDYNSVASFAAGLGLKSTWTQPQKTLFLQSEWTRLELNTDSREVRLNGIRLLLGDATVLHRGELLLSRTDERAFLGPILSPRSVPGLVPGARTVVIDAGHGGKDTGTSNQKLGLQEKGFALEVARALKRELEADGFVVIMTRDDDTFIPLGDRPKIAARRRADLFVSIHFNAIGNPSITGAETYVLTPRGQRSTGAEKRSPSDNELLHGHTNDPWNAILGYRVHRRVIDEMKSFDRGLKRARFVVLRELDCPGILVEGGYLTNDAEARRIATPEWRTRLATAIAGGIIEYREALEHARAR